MTEATQKLIHNKQDKSDFSNICGELLIDGQAVEIVSPQSWLQPSAGDYCHSILSVASQISLPRYFITGIIQLDDRIGFLPEVELNTDDIGGISFKKLQNGSQIAISPRDREPEGCTKIRKLRS